MAGLVGFEGSRSLGSCFAGLVSPVVGSVLRSGLGVATGCAAGADALVRSSARGSAVVFSVASGLFGSGRGAFAARSAALVRAVAASGPGAAFAVFVSSACPAGVVPARSWRSGSSVSGSWSSLALAAGLGLPVFVFWCAPGAPVLPAWAGGSWVPASAGSFAGSWSWVPAPVQPALF